MAPLKINVTFHCPYMTRERGKKKHSWAGVMSWALWNCCLLEKSRNTERKDGSKEGEVATGVRMDLMIPAHRHLTGGFFFFFSVSLLFIITIHTHTHKHTHTQTAGWDRNSFFFFFKQGEAFGPFCPLSLYIFLEHQASLPRLQLQSTTLLKVDEKFFGVSTWQKVFCHLSVV